MCGGGVFNVYLNQSGGGLEKVFGKKSKYQDFVPIQTNKVRAPRFLDIKEDTASAAAAEARLNAAEEVFEHARAAQESQNLSQAKLKGARDKAERAFEDKKKDLHAEKRLKVDIGAVEKKLAGAQADWKAMDVEKERKVFLKKLTLSVGKKIECLEKAQADAGAVLGGEVALGCARLSLEMAKDLEVCRKRAVAREEDALAAKQAEVEVAKHAFKAAKDKLKAARKDAERGAPIGEADGAGGQRATPLLAELESLPKVRPQVVAILETEQQAAASIHHNPAVVQKYNERKAEIDALHASIAEQAGAGGGAAAQFETLKVAWEAQTEQCCAKLNALFADYMAQLGTRAWWR